MYLGDSESFKVEKLDKSARMVYNMYTKEWQYLGRSEAMGKRNKRLVVGCSATLKSRVEAQARREDEAVAFIIRKALRLYLDGIKDQGKVCNGNQGK